jgi:elongator complex protein 6
MILSLAADTPLLRQQSTPLESQHSALVIGLAHQARLLMSARALSSGVAAEVSGVLRVKSDDSEGEWLYSLGKDGGVKVWLRGE